MSVGVMKDYKLKQRNLRASHTLGWSWNCQNKFYFLRTFKGHKIVGTAGWYVYGTGKQYPCN
jgi:hypothetical protein